MNWLKQNKIELFILSIFCFYITISQYIQNVGFELLFADNDDYMRVLRLREFFIHHDLNNSIIARGNYPYGVNLHWTRLYDFFLIAITYSVNFFVNLFDYIKSILMNGTVPSWIDSQGIIGFIYNDINQALEMVAFAITPVVKFICTCLMYNIVVNLQKNKLYGFITAALLNGVPFLFGYFSLGRPDHHAFMAMFILLYVSGIITSILYKKDKLMDYVKLACIISCCVWISPETLVAILVIEAVLFIAYFNDIEMLKKMYFKNMLVTCLLSIIVFLPGTNLSGSYLLVTSIFFLMIPYTMFNKYHFKYELLKYWHFIALLFIMLFSPLIEPIEYDKVSVVHILLFACSAIFFAINIQLVGRRQRVGDTILWAAVIGIIFLSMYPLFLKGMEGNISEYVKRIWLYRVSEMQSPLTTEIKPIFIAYVLISLVAALVKIFDMRRRSNRNINVLWAMLLSLDGVYLILSCFAYRMWPYFTLFSLPVIVNVCMESYLTVKLHKIIKILLSVFFSIIFIYPMGLFINLNCDKSTKCRNPKILCQEIEKLSNTPKVFMENCNLGTKILYYTKHCVLGLPYHRSTEGIVSCHKCLNETYNDEIVRKILMQTKTNYIIVQKQSKFEKNNLTKMINQNNYPAFLTPIKLSESCKDIIIMKVNL